MDNGGPHGLTHRGRPVGGYGISGIWFDEWPLVERLLSPDADDYSEFDGGPDPLRSIEPNVND